MKGIYLDVLIINEKFMVSFPFGEENKKQS